MISLNNCAHARALQLDVEARCRTFCAGICLALSLSDALWRKPWSCAAPWSPGLLDFESDVLYIVFEDFDNDELKTASVVILTLPIAIVAAVFWALVTVGYKHQKWRIALILIEGPLSLLWIAGTVTAFSINTVVQPIFRPALAASTAIKTTIFDNLAKLIDFVYVAKTLVETNKRQADGTKLNVRKHVKFYQQGLLQAIVTVLIAPVIILLGGVGGLALAAVLWLCSAAAMTVAGAFATVAALLATFLVPVVFAMMALLRLFVVFPASWEAIGHATVTMANSANSMSPFDLFDEDRADKVKKNIFNIYPSYGDNAKDVDDVKDLALKYLLLEFVLESLPQIIIQSTNNNLVGWSNIGIASMVVSAYAIVNTIYKYAPTRCPHWLARPPPIPPTPHHHHHHHLPR